MAVLRTYIVLLSLIMAGALHAQTTADGLYVARPDTLPSPLKPQQSSSAPPVMDFTRNPQSATFNSQPSSGKQVVLLIGDSMCDGLGRRFSDYATENGFEFHCVIWYGATTKSFATTRDLRYHLNRVHPTFVIISLGTNDMGYYDYSLREGWVQDILRQIGDMPYLWIGPLIWRKVRDRTIVDIIRRNTGEKHFYDSTPVYCQRLDGVHPTFPAAASWVDRIASWMVRTQLTEGSISWNLPQQKSVFRPDEKHSPRYRGRSM